MKTSVTRFVIRNEEGEYLGSHGFWCWNWYPNIWDAFLFREVPDKRIYMGYKVQRIRVGFTEEPWETK